MNGFVEINKVYADGRTELVCKENNILTDSLGLSLVNIFSDTGSSKVSDHIVGYFQVGGGHLSSSEDPITNKFISTLDAPFNESQYGEHAELTVLSHDLQKLHNTNFSPNLQDGVSRQAFVELPPSYTTKVLDDVVHLRLEIPESMCNGYSISEFGLFSKNPTGETGVDKSYLLAYKQFPIDEVISKTNDFSLVIDWQIKFVDGEEKNSEQIIYDGNDKYNVVFIMLDDVGFDYLGLYDSKNPYDLSSAGYPNANAFSQIESPDGCGIYPYTPTLSALASSGMLFYNTRAMPMCSPTRSTILAGKYNFSVKSTGQDSNGNLYPPIWGPGYGKVTGNGVTGQLARRTGKVCRSGLAAFNVEYPFEQNSNQERDANGNNLYADGQSVYLSDAIRAKSAPDEEGAPNQIAKQKVFSEYMEDIGYHSCFFGKWHLANWEDESLYGEDRVWNSGVQARGRFRLWPDDETIGANGEGLDGSSFVLEFPKIQPGVVYGPTADPAPGDERDSLKLRVIFRSLDPSQPGNEWLIWNNVSPLSWTVPNGDPTPTILYKGGLDFPDSHWDPQYDAAEGISEPDHIDQIVVPLWDIDKYALPESVGFDGTSTWQAAKGSNRRESIIQHLAYYLPATVNAYASNIRGFNLGNTNIPGADTPWAIRWRGYDAHPLGYTGGRRLAFLGQGTTVGHANRNTSFGGEIGIKDVMTLAMIAPSVPYGQPNGTEGNTPITYYPTQSFGTTSDGIWDPSQNWGFTQFQGGADAGWDGSSVKGESWGHVSSVGKFDHYVATWGNLNTGPKPGFDTSTDTWFNLAPGEDQSGWPSFGSISNGTDMGFVNYYVVSGNKDNSQVVSVSDTGYTTYAQTASGMTFAQGAASSFTTNYLLSEASAHFNDVCSCPEPFFMYITTNAPHTPATYPPTSLVHNNYYNSNHPQSPSIRADATNTSATWITVNAMMETFDASLSSFVEGLDHDRRSRTIFIVTSDNGSVLTDMSKRGSFCSGTLGLGTSGSVSLPFDSVASGGLGATYDKLLNLGAYASSLSPSAVRRGGENDNAYQFKASLYETGVLVPMIVTGGSSTPVVSGQTTEALVDLVDLLATVVHIGGGTDAIQDTNVPSDSLSFYNILKGTSDASSHQRQYSYGEIYFPIGTVGGSREWGSNTGYTLPWNPPLKTPLLNINRGATYGSDTTTNTDDTPVPGNPVVPRRHRRCLSVRLTPTQFEGYLGDDGYYGNLVRSTAAGAGHTGTIVYDDIPAASGGLWKLIRPAGNGFDSEGADENQQDDGYGRFLEELYHTQALDFSNVDKWELEDYIPEAWKAVRDEETGAAGVDYLVKDNILKEFVKMAVTEAGVGGQLDNTVHFWNLTRVFNAMHTAMGAFGAQRANPKITPFSNPDAIYNEGE